MSAQQPKSPSPDWTLAALLLLAFIIRLYYAHFASMAYPDEIFQTLEPAHRLAYGYGVITWEWRDGIRSWVLPAILAGVMRITGWIHHGSSGYLWGIDIILLLLSLTPVWFGYVWANRSSGREAAIIAAAASATWYNLIYFAPRALSEVVAAHILLPGLYLGMYGSETSERKRLFSAGLLCGLAMSLRIQLAPAVVFAAAYFCYQNWRKRVPLVAAGLLVPVVVFGLVDMFTWSYPFQSFVRYFWVNAVEGKATFYGTEPWYWYIGFLVRQFGPLLILAVFGLRKNALLGWTAFIIFLSHSVLAHKEPRFLYPLLPIVLTLAAIGLVELAKLVFRASAPRPGAVAAAGLACFIVFSCIHAVHFTGWTQWSGGVIAFDRLSEDANVCGVALDGVPWYRTGGYAHLHRDVPITIIQTSDPNQDPPDVNAVVTNGVLANPSTGFRLDGCWNGICLYRRDGPCSQATAADEVNSVLRKTGS